MRKKIKINDIEISKGDVLRVYGGAYWYGYREVDVMGKVAYSEKASIYLNLFWTAIISRL